MGYIADRKWYKKEPTIKWLNSNGFRYSKEYSDKDSDAYTYVFPVHKYKIFSLLECVLIVYTDNGDVVVKVQDVKTKEPYPQFTYDSQNNHKKFIEKIEKVIMTEFTKLGIEEIDNRIKLKKIINYSKYTKKFTYYCPMCDTEVKKSAVECNNCGKALLIPTEEELDISKDEVYVHD